MINAPIERYKVSTHIQSLDKLLPIYEQLENDPSIDSVVFEKGATIGYIICNISGEGIAGYEKAVKLLKTFKKNHEYIDRLGCCGPTLRRIY